MYIYIWSGQSWHAWLTLGASLHRLLIRLTTFWSRHWLISASNAIFFKTRLLNFSWISWGGLCRFFKTYLFFNFHLPRSTTSSKESSTVTFELWLCPCSFELTIEKMLEMPWIHKKILGGTYIGLSSHGEGAHPLPKPYPLASEGGQNLSTAFQFWDVGRYELYSILMHANLQFLKKELGPWLHISEIEVCPYLFFVNGMIFLKTYHYIDRHLGKEFDVSLLVPMWSNQSMWSRISESNVNNNNNNNQIFIHTLLQGWRTFSASRANI